MISESKKRILLIDDEKSVITFLKVALQMDNFEVFEANTGREGTTKVISDRPDLVVLDYGLPDIDGIAVLKEIRTWSQIPVIFLTVRDSEEDKIAALDAGADDYLTKPFNTGELLARIRVALRHAKLQSEEPIFRSGDLEIDRGSRKVTFAGKELKLTATEYSLLCLLSRSPGKAVPHRTVLREIWGTNAVDYNHYLRVYFGQIRKKIEAIEAGAGSIIENELGIGYRIRAEKS